jgi:hypothetical protein
MSVLQNIVNDNKFIVDDLPAFEAKLFFEGPKRRVNLERFVVLLFLSTVIATFGIIGDSVATVIGAMIVAPLMRPIMATAAGLVIVQRLFKQPPGQMFWNISNQLKQGIRLRHLRRYWLVPHKNHDLPS